MPSIARIAAAAARCGHGRPAAQGSDSTRRRDPIGESQPAGFTASTAASTRSGHAGLTDHGRWKAATLALGDGAVLSPPQRRRALGALAHQATATRTSPSPTQPRPRQAPGHTHLPLAARSHRAATTIRDGIPVTMPARTLADLAARRHAGRRAPRDPPGRGPRPAARRRAVSDRTDSDLERRLPRALPPLRRARRRSATCGSAATASTSSGATQRLVVEVDGYIYHRGRQAFDDDRDRDLELELARLHGRARSRTRASTTTRPASRQAIAAPSSRPPLHKIDQVAEEAARTARARSCS